jgi:hypothetical protein
LPDFASLVAPLWCLLVLVILVLGGPFEKAVDRRWPGQPSELSDRPPKRTRAPGAEM